jgi:hypothetical protein
MLVVGAHKYVTYLVAVNCGQMKAKFSHGGMVDTASSGIPRFKIIEFHLPLKLYLRSELST